MPQSRKIWWIAGVSIPTLAGLAAGGLQGGGIVFSLVVGLLVSSAFGREVFRAIHQSTEPIFGERIESWLPLRGRWLRLLIGTPGALIIWAGLWLTVSALIMLAIGMCLLAGSICLDWYAGR